MTARDALRAAARRIAPRDAALLVDQALGMGEYAVYRWPDAPMDEPACTRLMVQVAAREQGVPVAYLRGWREFHGHRFRVRREVLVPRPESEHLVEAVLELLDAPSPATVAELGVGSGAVLGSILLARARVRGIGTDIDAAALAVARTNLQELGVGGRVTLLGGDLVEPLVARGLRAEIVVMNPPYVPSAWLAADPLLAHEPAVALDGGADGLDFYRRLRHEVARVLAPGGWLVVELGAGQRPGVEAILGDLGPVRVAADLAGIERVMTVELAHAL